MSYIFILALVIPSLIFVPYLMAEHEVYALKIFNTDIRLEVNFTKAEQQPNADLRALVDNMDSGQLEQGLVDNMQPFVVGQFDVDDIEADWGGSFNFFTGVMSLEWNPEILEVNIPQGQPFGELNDIVIDGARPTITNYLQAYGITDFTWALYYDGGLEIIEESIP